MPVGSRVHKLYKQLLGRGYGKASAARIAQDQTGLALATGRKPKRKRTR